jgi:hypothetical protein
MKKLSLALLALATAVAFVPSAKANPVGAEYTYVFEGSGLNAVLTFDVTPDGGGVFTINDVTGTIAAAGYLPGTESAAGSLVPDPNPYPASSIVDFLKFDNLLYPDQSLGLDFYGLLLDVNGQYINIYSNDGSYEWSGGPGPYFNSSNTGNPVTDSEAEVSDAPEPSSLWLLGTGLLALAFVAFRKSKQAGLVFQS